jgi:hypothetical protein
MHLGLVGVSLWSVVAGRRRVRYRERSRQSVSSAAGSSVMFSNAHAALRMMAMFPDVP